MFSQPRFDVRPQPAPPRRSSSLGYFASAHVRPLDKAANADALRRRVDPTAIDTSAMPVTGIAPLLKKMIADYAATGLPPAYLPTAEKDDAV
jgi:hypothetical protein